MADINAMVLASTTVNIDEVYSAGLFAPQAAPGGSLETINGGFNKDNYAGGNDSIPMWAAQYGTHACAFYTGSFRQEFTYALQGGGKNKDGSQQRTLHAGLAQPLMLPWAASMLLYEWQAWWNHDATVWDSDGSSGGPKKERWDWRVQVDGTVVQGLYGRLPPGRRSTSLATDVAPAYVDPGIHEENRWRYTARVGASKNVAKGHHSVRISVWGGIFGPDPKLAKLRSLSWGLGILAIR